VSRVESGRRGTGARFPRPPHRTGRADFPHPALGLVSRQGLQGRHAATASQQLPLERPDLLWSCQTHRQSPLLRSFRSTQNRGPFPPPALPGFPGTMSPSDSHRGPPLIERLRASDSRSTLGLRYCVTLSLCVPPPLPRRATGTPGGSSHPGAPAFPVLKAGRHSQRPFGACSGFTARYGPQSCWPSFRGLLSGRLDDRRLLSDRPPVARGPNRLIAPAGLRPARTRHLCTAHSIRQRSNGACIVALTPFLRKGYSTTTRSGTTGNRANLILTQPGSVLPPLSILGCLFVQHKELLFGLCHFSEG